MPSMADVISAQAGGGPVYEPGGDTSFNLYGDILRRIAEMPSWLEKATAENKRAKEAFGAGVTPGQYLTENLNTFEDLAGGFGGTPIGIRGTIAGVKSRGADLIKLAKAQDMTAKGASPAEVWDVARWELQPMTGLWRYEIADRGTGWKPEAIEQGLIPKARSGVTRWGGKLGDLIEHPEMLYAQPDIAQWKMLWGDPAPQPGWINRAGMDAPGGKMFINPAGTPGGRKGMWDVFLHEVGGHGFQHLENFPRGGGPQHPIVVGAADAARSREAIRLQGAWDDVMEAQRRYVADEIRHRPDAPISMLENEFWAKHPDAARDKQIVQDTVARLNSQEGIRDILHKYYLALAGEVDARNVQFRKNFTEKQRAAQSLASTMDTPFAEQLVRLGHQ